MTIKNILSVVLPLLATNLYADSIAQHSYIGASIQSLSISPSGGYEDLSLRSAYGRFGDRLSEYVALELRIGTGTENVKVWSEGLPQGKAYVDKYYGAYLLGGIPVTEHLYPYIVAGFSKLEVEFNDFETGETLQSNPSSLSVGIGLNVFLRKNFTLNAEYLRIAKDKGLELSGPSIGIAFHF